MLLNTHEVIQVYFQQLNQPSFDMKNLILNTMIEEKNFKLNNEDTEESQQCSDETSEQLDEDSLSKENEGNNFDKPVIDKILSKNFNKNLSNLKEKQEFYHTDSSNKEIMGEDIDSSSLESEQDSQKEENINPYRFKSEEWLKDTNKRINKDIDILNKEDDHLTDEIDKISEQMRFVAYNIEQRSLKRQLEKVKADRDVCRQNREALENQIEAIFKELDRRKKDVNQSIEDTQSVSIESLFIENEYIESTILYVATFFPELSLSDFKRVVSRFLRERTVSITKSQTIIEDGKAKTIETQEKHSLVKKWEESVQEPNKADKTLKKCFLKVRRKEYSLVVDFSLLYLRTEFIQYFHEEQAFYIEEQYKLVQVFLFDVSEHVANSAINLLAEAAIYYPNDYGADWLLYITATAEAIKSELLFERVSKLIFQMQIVLEPAQSQRILKTFLGYLLAQERNYVFGITLYLINRQLYSNLLTNKINSLKQLLNWLKQVLDQGNKEQKANAYGVLERLLLQKDSHKYIYDILGILNAWLPEPERPHEKYSPSNQASLLLIVSYCGETINKFSIEKYGCWPSKYSLFASMRNDSDVDSRLNLLINWLFQPSGNQGLAINYVLPDEMDAIHFIGFLIAEWFTILYGLQEDKLKPEASKLADSLLRQVVIIARRSEHKQLTEFWAVLANLYLEEAANYAQSGANNQYKRELVRRRKLVKELRNRFKALQQETLTAG